MVLSITTIFLAYSTVSAYAQQLGSDQPCSASYPCTKICGDHICAVGETPNESPINQTVAQSTNTTMSSPSQSSSSSTASQFKLSTKGMISSSSGIAPGTAVWTILNGNNGVFIFHGIKGLEVIRVSTTPDQVCNNAQAQICLDTTVTQAKDPDQIATIGTNAKINIHPIENQETVGFLSGPFQNIVLQIDLSKIWTYPGASTTPITKIQNTTTTSSSTSSNMMNSTATNSTIGNIVNSTSNSTSMHGTMINPNSTNGASVNVTNSTFR